MSPVTLTNEQARASDMIISYLRNRAQQVRPFVMFGLAGTGKTTVLSHVARQVPDALLCTLTGKAASILRRKTGLMAETIHSAFYRLREKKKSAAGREELKFDPLYESGELSGSVLLLDECSMIDERMAQEILASGVQIVACGDPGQLPPVRGVQYFQVPDVELLQIHRQAQESPILRQAHAVRAGLGYQADGERFVVCKEADADPELMQTADTFLCWTNPVRRELNGLIRRARGIWQEHPTAGELVMCLKNNRHFGLLNGATYHLLEAFRPGQSTMLLDVDGTVTRVPRVWFEGMPSAREKDEETVNPFSYGYAMTVHKAQGSEWDSVVLIDDHKKPSERVKWLYTGITRAAERIVVVRG